MLTLLEMKHFLGTKSPENLFGYPLLSFSSVVIDYHDLELDLLQFLIVELLCSIDGFKTVVNGEFVILNGYSMIDSYS